MYNKASRLYSWKEFSALATTEKLSSFKFLAHTWLLANCREIVFPRLSWNTFYPVPDNFGYIRKRNLWDVFDRSVKLGVLTCMVKRFTRLCSPCLLVDELKTLQNTFLALGYPSCLISEVITRAKNLSVLKMFGSQKCPVYLKHSSVRFPRIFLRVFLRK